jgi:DNA-binding LacI/PurR family transcriptional regulator
LTYPPITTDLPKFEQLKLRLLEQVGEGRLSSQQRLPPEPVLARTFQVARGTIRRALRDLEADGIIRRTPGRGTFINPIDHGSTQRLPSSIFAILLPEVRRSIYPSLVKGLEHGARENQHQLLVCNTDWDIGRQADFILQLIDKGIAGVAMVPTTLPPTPAHQIRLLQSNGIPVVCCHRAVEGAATPLVTWDGMEIGRLAGQAFIERGHRSIAYFGAYRYPLVASYEVGLRQALQAEGLDLPLHHVHYGDNAPDHESDDAKRIVLTGMFLSANHPTAVLCSDDTEAETIYLLLSEMGFKIPGDVSIIGFGTHWRSGSIRKRLASVLVDEHALGEHAARLLYEMSRGMRPLTVSEHFHMPLTLLAGQTLSTASAAWTI